MLNSRRPLGGSVSRPRAGFEPLTPWIFTSDQIQVDGFLSLGESHRVLLLSACKDVKEVPMTKKEEEEERSAPPRKEVTEEELEDWLDSVIS